MTVRYTVLATTLFLVFFLFICLQIFCLPKEGDAKHAQEQSSNNDCNTITVCVYMCFSVFSLCECALLAGLCMVLFRVCVSLDLILRVFSGMYGCVCKCASKCLYVWGLRGDAGVEGFLSQDSHNGWRERLPRWQAEEGTTYTTTNNKRKTR